MWTIDSIPLEKLVDRIGRKRGLMMSMTMTFLTSIGFLFSNRIELFVFFNTISALDVGFWMPSYLSYITETFEQEKRSTVFGKLDATR
jgi:MFS family permease